jgi:hypothetical protein
MIFLSTLRRRPDAEIDRERFPWTLPLVRDLETREFTAPGGGRRGLNELDHVQITRAFLADPAAHLRRVIDD